LANRIQTKQEAFVGIGDHRIGFVEMKRAPFHLLDRPVAQRCHELLVFLGGQLLVSPYPVHQREVGYGDEYRHYQQDIHRCGHGSSAMWPVQPLGVHSTNLVGALSSMEKMLKQLKQLKHMKHDYWKCLEWRSA